MFIVNTETGCWEWNLSRLANGYGQYRGTTAHRWIYAKVFGSIPRTLQLHHSCLNKGCVNPLHVVPMTAKDHVRITPNHVKVNPAHIASIREAVVLRGTTYNAVAKKFGLTRATVGYIVRGDGWTDAPGPRFASVAARRWHKTGLTAERIAAAKLLRRKGWKFGDIAKQMGVSKANIHKIITGRKYDRFNR